MRDEHRLAERLAELEDWRRDGFDAMIRWAEAVGVDERLVRINPQLAVKPTDVMLRDEDMTALPQEDFLWTVSHLMGFVAELLRDKHGGEWVVDEDPASPMYTDFLVVSGPKRFNPGLIVKAYIDTAPPRDLYRALAQAHELADRQVGLEAWKHEAARLAHEFAPIAGTLRDQDLDAYDDGQREWLHLHLLAFAGERLRADHKGRWQVDDDPESPSYTTYVVVTRDGMFDPWRIVLDYLGTPPPRRLFPVEGEDQ